jgi:large subunit ribosomal protein L1
MGGRDLLPQDGPAVRTKHNMANKQGKKYVAAAKQVEARAYSLAEAVPLVKKIKFSKFDETLEVHMRLGVDP